MDINPLQADPIDRRVPQLVRLVLTQLEMLKLGRMFSTEKILSSFYNLDSHEYFEHSWDHIYESKLTSTKDKIDQHEFKVSNETDTRVLGQVMLDFLELLTEPAISELTISHLAKLTESGVSSHDILNKQLDSDKISDRLGAAVLYS